jgi:hypothetical protein
MRFSYIVSALMLSRLLVAFEFRPSDELVARLPDHLPLFSRWVRDKKAAASVVVPVYIVSRK